MMVMPLTFTQRQFTSSLISPDVGPGNCRAEIWIFPGALGAATPARVTSDVHHWRVEPVDACRTRFDSSHVSEFGDHFRIPARCCSERYRKDGAKPVNNVCSKEQGNVQPCAIDSRVLEVIGKPLADSIQHGAKLALLRQLIAIYAARPRRIDVQRGCRDASVFSRMSLCGAVLDQLPDLLLKGHSCQEIVDLPLDLLASQL